MWWEGHPNGPFGRIPGATGDRVVGRTDGHDVFGKGLEADGIVTTTIDAVARRVEGGIVGDGREGVNSRSLHAPEICPATSADSAAVGLCRSRTRQRSGWRNGKSC